MIPARPSFSFFILEDLRHLVPPRPARPQAPPAPSGGAEGPRLYRVSAVRNFQATGTWIRSHCKGWRGMDHRRRKSTHALFFSFVASILLRTQL
jgi:hypothetical protein